MHEHNECNHNLKYCSKCDVVYCTKCSREWGGHLHSWWGSPYKITYYETPVYKNNDTITVSCNHT